MKLNLRTVLIFAAVALVAMKFKDDILGIVAKVPVAGPLVANLAA